MRGSCFNLMILSLSVFACSSPKAKLHTAPLNHVQTRAVPAPKGIQFVESNSAHYSQFENHQAARDFFVKAEGNLAAQQKRSPRKLIEVEHKLQQTANNVVSEQWSSFQKLFSADTQGLSKPQILVIEDSVPMVLPLNSVFAENTTSLIFNAVVISRASFEGTFALSHVHGAISNAISQVILKHVWPKAHSQLKKTFLSTAEKPFGLLAEAQPVKQDETSDSLLKEGRKIYSNAEQADDASVLILFDQGIEPTAHANWLLKMLSGEEAEKCKSILDQNTEPQDQAATLTTEASHCWRIWHTKKLVSFLKE